mmetsp:Transcript_106390/g.266575  ORF Transcript_106390/g.266575 Transcript_106390/m.266575 type:complete len:252 (+) Transcript_106390:755-1510(+)
MSCSGSVDANAAFPIASHVARGHEAIWIAPGSGSQAFGHVKLRAFVVIAVNGEKVSDLDRARGFGRDWVDRIMPEVRVVVRQADDAKLAVGAPDAPATVELLRVLPVAVDSREVERLSKLPPSFSLCNTAHGGAEEKICRVREVDVPDDEHVGCHCHMVIRYPLRGPDGARAAGVREDVENEDLLRVAHHEALRAPLEAPHAVEAVRLRQAADELHRLARRARALHRDARQAVDAEERFATAADGGGGEDA